MSRFWLCFPVMNEWSKSSLTNNMLALYRIDQSWCKEWSKWWKCAYKWGVLDLKRRCTDRSVYDINVPQEWIESIRSRLLSKTHRTLMSCTDRSEQCKEPKPGYFRQYRNPGQDLSGKNGVCGHPTYWWGMDLDVVMFKLCPALEEFNCWFCFLIVDFLDLALKK